MLFVLVVGLLLAFANGANDNFKGVASLFGSGTTNFRGALAWATVTTLLGSAAALLLAGELLARFRGKGIVPDEWTLDPAFLGSVALGAGATVLLATRLGLPTSTTHALVGALVGAGLGAGGPIQTSVLFGKVLVPLLASPVIALAATALLYRVFRSARARLGVDEQSCVCVDVPVRAPAAALAVSADGEALFERTPSSSDCDARPALVKLRAVPTLDALHFLSAGALSFARGLNDTPKIAALLLIVPALDAPSALVLTGVAIALGGLLAARRVAQTMSRDITTMNAGQGFTANLVSSALVIVASPLGVPVSTTHVTCGALFGLGLASGGGRAATITKIVLAWVLTLPLAGALAFGAVRVSAGA